MADELKVGDKVSVHHYAPENGVGPVSWYGTIRRLHNDSTSVVRSSHTGHDQRVENYRIKLITGSAS